MRILHTSDWHVGRTFHGVDLLPDQRDVLASLARVVAENAVDVVVVPGDVYDRAIPSADAVRVCNKAFEDMRAAGAVIVATSGNHDSPARLGAGASFAAAGGLHLFTTVSAVGTPYTARDAHGPVAFYGIPYLDPEATRAELGVPQARSHTAVLRAAMSTIRDDIVARSGGGQTLRSVVLAHAFVVGGSSSESERSISVGGVETVAAEEFSGIDYVALGHLHSPQTIDDHIRYSGSPLPYSFAERSHRKAAWLVELTDTGVESVTRVDLPVVRPLVQVRGTVDELVTDDRFDHATDAYVSAVLTDPVRPVDAMRRLQKRFAHAVHLEWDRPASSDHRDYRDRVVGRSDADVMAGFVTDVRSSPTPSEIDLLETAMAVVTSNGDTVATDIAESTDDRFDIGRARSA